MKSALVYDWFGEFAGGGEKHFEMLYEMFPSPIYTLLKNSKSVMGMSYEKAEFHTSFIQNLPGAQKWYSHYLPLFPMAIERFDLSEYDLVISSSHCVAKGILTHAEQLHLCYCHTPVRYAWDLYFSYMRPLKGMKRWAAEYFLRKLRAWDLQARVDGFAANSQFVARRIERLYGKKARVIYPAIETDFFTLEKKKEDFYVAASRIVPYKKMDLIVEAFRAMPEKKLVVIGDGPDLGRLKGAKNIEILGYQPKEVLRLYLQKGKALVFAALEDFGLVPVEAQGCGTPVIAYGKGGALETVVNGVTGLFFKEQTVPSIIEAVNRFEKMELDPEEIQKNGARFSPENFKKQFKAWVEEKWNQRFGYNS